MGHVHRFFISPEALASREGSWVGGTITLDPEEAHHAVRVARVRAGDGVRLFDGCGRDLGGVVRCAHTREVLIEVASDTCLAKPTPALTLVQACLDHENPMEGLIRHCTALGVASFCFFRARHSNRPPRHSERWARIAAEACKQSGNVWLPTFRTAGSMEEALDGLVDVSLAEGLFIATEHGCTAPLKGLIRGTALALLVGPEGDFTSDEIQNALERGAKPISLGPATLRSEVAAVTGATLLLYEAGRLGPLPG